MQPIKLNSIVTDNFPDRLLKEEQNDISDKLKNY